MRHHDVGIDVRGPWSLVTSRTFWEGFAPSALPGQDAAEQLRTVFCAEADWHRVETTVSQQGGTARIRVSGNGDLDAAAAQVCRFLSLDVDARGWPEVGSRDPVMADAQAQLPGLRPCGFHSPYEAAAWAVLSQRIRIVQAARLRDEIVRRHGDHGAFPTPQTLRTVDLDLPSRKNEYLHAVAEAALEGRLDAGALRAVSAQEAVAGVQEIKGLGPFAAELVVLRGATAPDMLPLHERRLEEEIGERYGTDRSPTDVAEAWRPFRTWGAVHLRILRERRTAEIAGRAGHIS